MSLPSEPDAPIWLSHQKEAFENRLPRLPRFCVERKHSIGFKEALHNHSDFFRRDSIDTKQLALRHVQVKRCYEFLKQVLALHDRPLIIISPSRIKLLNC